MSDGLFLPADVCHEKEWLLAGLQIDGAAGWFGWFIQKKGSKLGAPSAVLPESAEMLG